MVECREVIMLCRQIGGMMEAGVDILRITRVLRAQTQNPRLLELYNSLDHDMRMGQSLADAMSRAPDVFSPFITSLVQQGEARNDLAGAFMRIADHLQKEEDSKAPPPPPAAAEGSHARSETPSRTLTRQDVMELIEHLQLVTLRLTTLLAGLLLTLAGVWWMVEIGFIERRWLNATLCSVSALFIAGAGVWVRRRIEADRRNDARCSVCGVAGSPEAEMAKGVKICFRCASAMNPDGSDQSREKPRTFLQPEPAPVTARAGAVVAGSAISNHEATATSGNYNGSGSPRVAPPIGEEATYD